MPKVGKSIGPQSKATILGIVLAIGVGVAGWKAWSTLPVGPLEKARASYARKDWQAAWALASERLRSDPNDFDALLISARATARLGRDDLAQTIYDGRIGMERMNGEDFFLLGAGLIRQDKVPMAMVALEQGLKIEPPDPELLQELARIYALSDSLSKATGLAKRLAEIPGWEARGELLGGILAAERSDPADSARHIDLALKKDARLYGATASPSVARKLLARGRLQLGETSVSKGILETVLANGPDNEAEWLLSRAFLIEGNLPAASAALGRSQGYGDDTAAVREPSPYVGAAKCAECHSAIHGSQQKSLHARTFGPTSELGRLKLPDRPVVDPDSKEVVHTYKQEADRVRVETRVGDRTYRALVEYAIGSGDRGLTLIGRDEAGDYRELRLSHYNDGSGWDRTTGHSPTPHDPAAYLGEPLPPDAVRRCLHCHTTDAHEAEERVGLTVADHSIGCERCHGPGGGHVKAVETHFPDLAIARPQHFSAPKVIQLCGQCHSPRGAAIGDSSDRSNVRFQASMLIKSRCYTESEGALTCLTCHNPHRDAETSVSFYESKCLSCHDPRAVEPKGKSAHVASCPVNAKTDCLKCHMPVVKDAVPHSSFSDHNIRIHKNL